MLVSDIKEEAKAILGQCDDQTIFTKITRAVELLANKGYWNPMIGLMDICACVDGRTVTLPRDVEVPLAVNTNGNPGFFRNRWFEFHLNGPGSDAANRNINCQWVWDDSGDVPTFMDIIEPSYVAVIAQQITDLDKHIRFFGFDETKQWIRTQEPDGTWMDGFVPPTNLFSDFPQGILVPDTTRLFKRIFSAGEIDKLISVGAHNLTTGAEVLLALISAPMPAPLVDGGTYFVRVVDSTTVKLYNTRTEALTDQNAIQITSSSGSSQVSLTDMREVAAQTKFNSVAVHKIATGTLVQFTGAPLPSPVTASTDYYAEVLDANNVVIHSNSADAVNSVNPINVTTPGTTVVMRPKLPANPITKLVFPVSHNFITGDLVNANTTGILPTPLDTGIDYFVRNIDSTSITIHNTQADAVNNVNPIVLLDNGAGTHSIVKIMNCSASTGTNNNITAVGHNLSAGSFVSFQTTGTFPTPVAANTVYSSEAPMSADTFSLYDTSPAAVNITAIGTGQLKLVISRAFTVGFTGDWAFDVSLLATGDVIRIATTGTLPAAIPTLGLATDYYLRKLTDIKGTIYPSSAYASDLVIRATTTRERTTNVAKLGLAVGHGFINGDVVDISGVSGANNYNGQSITITAHTATSISYANSGADEVTTADTGGAVVVSPVHVSSFGSGNLSVDRLISITSIPRSSNLLLEDGAYLTNGVTVRFTTTGTLPAPLAAATDYILVIQSANEISLLTSGGSPITLTTVGSGTHNMVITKVFGVVPANNFNVISNVYNNGDAITVLQGDGGTLPSPLVNNTVYYVRRIDADTVELYDTAAHAINTASTTGRITPATAGVGTNYFTQTLPNIQVSRVERLLKDESLSFMEAYAFDNGRSEAFTKIGFFYPDETEPRYRRIKVAMCCSWVRIRYRKKTFKITSDNDWISLNSGMAIILMMRAMKLFEDNFFDDAKKYEFQAETWLVEENVNNAGPDSVTLQIDDRITGNPDAQWMT